MEIGVREIDDLLPAAVPDVGVADIPLARHGPVECPSTCGHFMDFDADMPAEEPERLAHAVAGDASADRIDLRGKRMDRLADVVG
jgi:hypothetical protein